jgi:hypothetical protein
MVGTPQYLAPEIVCQTAAKVGYGEWYRGSRDRSYPGRRSISPGRIRRGQLVLGSHHILYADERESRLEIGLVSTIDSPVRPVEHAIR